jgi:hypothetical protein
MSSFSKLREWYTRQKPNYEECGIFDWTWAERPKRPSLCLGCKQRVMSLVGGLLSTRLRQYMNHIAAHTTQVDSSVLEWNISLTWSRCTVEWYANRTGMDLCSIYRLWSFHINHVISARAFVCSDRNLNMDSTDYWVSALYLWTINHEDGTQEYCVWDDTVTFR